MAATWLSGCETSPLSDGLPAGIGCDSCHGKNGQPAPPNSLSGEAETSQLGVGAHQAHLQPGTVRGAISCSECHKVPTTIDQAGHVDPLPADVVFGPLALAGGLQASWDRDAGRCNSTYCHGDSLTGGAHTAPEWTRVDGSQKACDACHGNPPPTPHPQRGNCAACHPQTVLADGRIDLASGKHIDGSIDSGNLACNGCHGSDDNAAPPLALDGSDDTDNPGVGAHQSHLTGGSIRTAMACEACHLVPAAPSDPGHTDSGLPAELSWGPLATADGQQPSWASDQASCANTYCHGASLSGGSLIEPSWTTVNGSQAACGTCHGNPPPAPHTANGDCRSCHPGTVDENGSIDLAGGQHIDGLRQFQVPNNMACDLCHAAPPATASHAVHYGASPADASYGGTGATADLLPGGNVYAFDCGNCHPTDLAQHANGVSNPGGGSAEIDLDPSKAPLGSLKARNPMNAAYTPGAQVFSDAQGFSYTQGTCSNVYCHSRKQFSTPGGVPEPGVDFVFNGYPIVYPAYTVDESRVYTSPTWGQSLSCDACHGFPPRSSVPDVNAGAGDSHSWIDGSDNESLHGWNMGFDPVACATCHYETVTDQGVRSRDPGNGWSIYQAVPIAGFDRHVDGWPNVAFTDELVSLRTDHDLTTAAWDPIAGTCSNTSCHLQENPVAWGEPYRYNNGAECNQCHQFRAEDVPAPASSRLSRNK
jgi:predicted CxxxxCH...CXXCH cytochrome family protein